MYSIPLLLRVQSVVELDAEILVAVDRLKYVTIEDEVWRRLVCRRWKMQYFALASVQPDMPLMWHQLWTPSIAC